MLHCNMLVAKEKGDVISPAGKRALFLDCCSLFYCLERPERLTRRELPVFAVLARNSSSWLASPDSMATISARFLGVVDRFHVGLVFLF